MRVNKGLSLLEILISTLILALVVTGLLGIFIQGKSLSQHYRARISGGELGKYFIEPLQLDVRQDFWGINCLGSNNCNNGSQILNGISYTVTYDITSGDNIEIPDTLRRANVTITWNDTTS